MSTHEVQNQAPPLEDDNVYASHLGLQEALVRGGAGWAHAELTVRGAEIGSAAWRRSGELANLHPPELRLFDRFGHRLDEFEFHDAWHQCLRYLKGHGVATGAWAHPVPGAHVRRAALFQLFAQIECGSLCPTTMTYGAVPAVSREPDLARFWLPRLLSPEYDGSAIPAERKAGVLMGMGMTEKQGGSDVRANTTRAEPAGEGWYRLTGHKWFFSAAMCDAFLVTAQASEGLTCFLLPRFTPEGRRNAIAIQRAKSKMGDRSNASCEVEFDGALAQRVGEPGRGIPTVIEMATFTRLDCANGSAGLARAVLAQALHHAHHRRVFGALLVDQPAMRNVLADLAIEVEGLVALSMRVAAAFDRRDDPFEARLARVLTPVAKFWVCKRVPALAAEAMEVLGGNGYVEEGPMPRLYRQMPLNSIWEGSGNVMALDLLRALRVHPDSLEALYAELDPARGRHAAFDRFVGTLKDEIGNAADVESRARRLLERIALAVQAALLLRYAPPCVHEAFCVARLGGEPGQVFGVLPANLDHTGIVRRAWPG